VTGSGSGRNHRLNASTSRNPGSAEARIAHDDLLTWSGNAAPKHRRTGVGKRHLRKSGRRCFCRRSTDVRYGVCHT
jgi:hypothetical protein